MQLAQVRKQIRCFSNVVSTIFKKLALRLQSAYTLRKLWRMQAHANKRISLKARIQNGSSDQYETIQSVLLEQLEMHNFASKQSDRNKIIATTLFKKIAADEASVLAKIKKHTALNAFEWNMHKMLTVTPASILSMNTVQRAPRKRRMFNMCARVIYAWVFGFFCGKRIEIHINIYSIQHVVQWVVRWAYRIYYGLVATYGYYYYGTKRSNELVAYAMQTYMHASVQWSKTLDVFFEVLQFIKPTTTTQFLPCKNYCILLQYQMDVLAHPNAGYTLPLTSDIIANAQMFRRSVQNKTLVRRTIAHSAFVINRRRWVTNVNRDRYQSYKNAYHT